ncbi:kinase-like domain-containing protein [Aspergillus cavernicola]|uniref:Kinase-like domain-containing protein n=1 Tax=Aspergillus cavernicola TaxID=176166 RepID=A0ABR4IEU6_9EURO
MAASAYNILHDEVYREVYSKLERQDHEGLRFAPIGTAERILHPDKLRRFFQSLLEPTTSVIDQFNMTDDDLLTRVIERELHEFFAILIFAGCPILTARVCTTVLIANNTWPVKSRRKISFSSLPADREDLKELFQGDDIATDKFIGKQAYFCPVVIRKGEEVRVENTDYRRLPYLDGEQKLREGAFGKVYKVKICPHHFYDPSERSTNPEPLEIARKDYEISRDPNVEKERDIMEKIFAGSSTECPNILRNLGSLAFGPTNYSLFMPLAICDLQAYMMENYQARPNSIAEKKNLISCAMGLADGLSFLHKGMKTSEMEELVCYHMDLKPRNILIFQETEGGRPTRHIWKISDFGMARMKVRRHGKDVVGEQDVNSWFVRRSPIEGPSVSATRNPRADGTYLAPESTSQDRIMRADSDVWSLGCVLSVLFVYLEEGSKGVEEYTRARGDHDEAQGCDFFFLSSRRFRSMKVHPGVSKTHDHLIHKASERSHHEGEIVEFALRYLEDHVLQVDQSKRAGAEHVKKMLENTFKRYRRLEAVPPAPIPEGNASSQSWSERVRRTIRPSKTPPRGDAVGHGDLEQWYLANIEAAKGCEIAPDCSLVAYWTDRKISLYSSGSLSPNLAKPVAQHELTGDGYLWKSIRLTQSYLIASTTSPSFHCFIFNLAEGLEEGVFKICYVVELTQPAISKFAISPDSRTLACILKSGVDDRQPGSLFVADITDLIARVGRVDSNVPPGETPHEQSGSSSNIPNAKIWWTSTLRWPATEVTNLSFSKKDDIYFVVLPEPTVRRREHRISVVHINLETRDMDILPVQSQGLDSSTIAPLFTCFAPFHRETATCAIVTREKKFHIQNIGAQDLTGPIRRDIKKYRILRLMIGSCDEKMYALARESTNYRMLLLEMTVPRSINDELCPRELAHLPDLSENDQFTERLCDTDREKCILIAALVGRDQCAVYRVGLDGTGANA